MSGPPLLAGALGIAVTQFLPVLPELAQLWPMAVAALLSLAGLALLSRLGGSRAAPLVALLASVPLAFLLGLGYGIWRADQRLADALPLAWERKDIVVEGVIAELPRDFDSGRRFTFRVENVLAAPPFDAERHGEDGVAGQFGVPQRIMLSWHAGQGAGATVLPRLVPGERWRFTVRLKRPHGNANPGGFDYEAWLLERGIRATGYVRATPAAERLGVADARPGERIEALRADIRSGLQNNLPAAPYAGVVVALAVGDQGSIPSDHWRIFAATGTTHLMSISGLHVTMLAALCGILGGWLWRRSEWLMLRQPAQRAAISIGWVAACAYTLLAGAGVPALRTLLMLSVAALTHWLYRRVGVGRTLLLALLAVLLYDPWAVLAVGFWLSFTAVAVLLVFAAESDDGGAGQRDGLGGKQRKGGILMRLRQFGHVQWVVSLGTLPILIWVFQQFSLVSPLANALAIPLVGLVIAPLSVAAALLPLPVLASMAHAVLEPLMVLLAWLAEQPWALWRQAQPPEWAMVLAGVGIAAHFLARRLPWSWRCLPLLFVVPALWPPVARPAAGEAWIEVLDVGHGLSVLVRTARHSALFDAGPRYSSSDAGERLVVPALRALGVQGLDALVVSHHDNDHAGGVESVMRELPVAQIYTSLNEAHPLRQGATPHRRCEDGVDWDWDGVAFRFLSPPADYYTGGKTSSNRLSCVLRIEAVGSAMLLTGDAELPEESRLLGGAPQRLAADVLQVPHHGSRSSSGRGFVQAVAPSIAVVPAGYGNPFGHPHPEVVARYREIGARIVRTDRDGAVSLRLGNGVVVTTQREARPRYWDGR